MGANSSATLMVPSEPQTVRRAIHSFGAIGRSLPRRRRPRAAQECALRRLPLTAGTDPREGMGLGSGGGQREGDRQAPARYLAVPKRRRLP
jgi:hypothetical protein